MTRTEVPSLAQRTAIALSLEMACEVFRRWIFVGQTERSDRHRERSDGFRRTGDLS